MTGEQLKEFTQREPFEPFTIHLSDGSRLKVSHPESLVLPPGWNYNAIVALPRERFTVVFLRNVTHVSSRGAIVSMPKRKRGGRGEGDEWKGDDE